MGLESGSVGKYDHPPLLDRHGLAHPQDIVDMTTDSVDSERSDLLPHTSNRCLFDFLGSEDQLFELCGFPQFGYSRILSGYHHQMTGPSVWIPTRVLSSHVAIMYTERV